MQSGARIVGRRQAFYGNMSDCIIFWVCDGKEGKACSWWEMTIGNGPKQSLAQSLESVMHSEGLRHAQ